MSGAGNSRWQRLVELVLEHERQELREHYIHSQVFKLALQGAQTRLIHEGADDEFFRHRKSWGMKFAIPDLSGKTPIEMKDSIEEQLFKMYMVWWKEM